MDRDKIIERMTDGGNPHRLFFDNSCFGGMIGNKDFLDLGDYIVDHRGPKHLEKFTLNHTGCTIGDVPRMVSWIQYAKECDVKILEIYIPVRLNDSPIILPHLLECDSLENLNVRMDFISPKPPTSRPCLKVLDIRIRDPDYQFLKQLLASCPVLEELSLSGELKHEDDVHPSITIPSSTLKILKLMFITSDFERCSNLTFAVDTPRLELLEIEDATVCTYLIQGDLPFLLHASLGIGHTRYIKTNEITTNVALRVLKLLEGLRKAHHLTIFENSAAAIGHALDPEKQFPQFPSLERLELAIDNCYDWTLFPCFLKNAPLLNFLELEKQQNLIPENDDDFEYEVEYDEDEDNDDEEDDEDNDDEEYDDNDDDEEDDDNDDEEDDKNDDKEAEEVEDAKGWIAPVPIPYCLRMCLRQVQIKDLMGTKDEKQVLMYLLANCNVLERMKITFDRNATKQDFDEEVIESFPRGSPGCVLEFGEAEDEA